MINFFKKKHSKNETGDLHGTDLLNEYSRLVNYGQPDLFLDYDTTLILDSREELETELKSGSLSSDDQTRLAAADSILKEKVAYSLAAYVNRIQKEDKSSDYLKAVLIDLRHYCKDEPKSKWWYHLLDVPNSD